jgi:hypothetical protein
MTRGDGALRSRALRTLIVTIGIVLALPVAASADAPPGPYFNGFEQNTQGWFNLSGGTIHREPSGYVGSGYASGVPSATGSWHARLGKDPNPSSCTFGGGVAPIHTGPYTNWGGYSSFFPPGGYTTRLDIYLDVQWAQTHPDQRYDWSSAINDTTGGFRRDFVFNVGTDPLGFVMSASNNSTRCSSFPANPARLPIQIVASGWYTFEHVFTGVPGSPLVVAMRVINKATNVTVGAWVLSNPTDIVGVTVGGNRYGWFVQNEIDDLAIDNSERTGIVSTPGCEAKINNGGRITALNTDTATFGGNAKSTESGATSGQQIYQDHGPVQPLTIKALTVQAIICNDDLTEAEIYGLASVNGTGEHEYRIKLRDGGEPSTDDQYGITVPSVGYASGDRPLEGGNVQIRGETS